MRDGGSLTLHPRLHGLRRLVSPRAVVLLLMLIVIGWAAPSPVLGDESLASRSEPALPSLLLVTFDTTRADALGVHGRAPSPTPNLDALAATGVRFERALAPTPVTVPSHASMLTGLVPRHHGVRDNAPFVLGAEHETLSERLREAGYQTAAVLGAAVLDRATGLDQGFEIYDDQVRVGPRRWFDWRERAASQVGAAAREHLARLESPFFLWVHLYDPHLPYVPPEPYASRFADDPYLGEVAFADAVFGEVLAAARERTRHLVVAAASDHGESLGEHGERDHGVFVYQATQHVFWIVAGPGVPAGRVIDPWVGLIDVAPTLLALTAGGRMNTEVDGRDVSRLWGDEPPSALVSRAFELESLHPAYAYGWSPLAALVEGSYKFVEAPEVELYDLGAGPGERENLAGQRGDMASSLRARLAARIADDPERARLAAGTAEAVDIDPERLAALRALGYVSGGATAPGEARPDPKQGIAWLKQIHEARHALTRPERPRETGQEVAAGLTALLEKNPGNHEARRLLATAWLTAGRPGQAVSVLEEAIERVPRDDAAWVQLGAARIQAAAGKPEMLDAAEQALEHALELRARNADAARMLANLRIDRGRPDAARALLRSMAALEALDPALATMLGELEAALGAPQPARAAFERALALDPAHAPALESLGKLAHAQGRAADAARHYEALMEIAPSARTARTLGAIRLLELDDRPGAIEAFRRALSLEPAGPDADRIRALLDELEESVGGGDLPDAAGGAGGA